MLSLKMLKYTFVEFRQMSDLYDVIKIYQNHWWQTYINQSIKPVRAHFKLDSVKARKKLNWRPKLSIDEALLLTYEWFANSLLKTDMSDFSLNQIEKYQQNE